MRADDALTAISHGADAIIVSNHGARQLDGVLATIDALPSIVEAVSASGKKVRLSKVFSVFSSFESLCRFIYYSAKFTWMEGSERAQMS